jgi:hypothetical protein
MKDYQYHIFSPYRVCPLGAHVDHQHGLVTGFAINKGVDLDVTGGQVPRHVTWFMYPKYAELGRALNQSVSEAA